MSVLSQPQFHDEAKAFEFLEGVVWANGIVCPQCGAVDGRLYDLAGVRSKPSVKHPEGVVRHGLKKCGECRKQFTVKVGTVFEHARMPLHKMLQAVHLMVSSKKGISSHQLSRILEVQYKSAWFLAHRIREAMKGGDLGPLGGLGAIVEADETFIGIEPGAKIKPSFYHKMKVFSLIDRSSGQARSFVVDGVHVPHLQPIMRQNVHPLSILHTDEANAYKTIGRHFYRHESVNHGALQFGRGKVHTNTIEGFFSIFKRGMKGVYQHCSKKHLHRYLAEFDFRYSNRIALGVNDKARAVTALRGITGKRLTYETTGQRTA